MDFLSTPNTVMGPRQNYVGIEYLVFANVQSWSRTYVYIFSISLRRPLHRPYSCPNIVLHLFFFENLRFDFRILTRMAYNAFATSCLVGRGSWYLYPNVFFFLGGGHETGHKFESCGQLSVFVASFWPRWPESWPDWWPGFFSGPFLGTETRLSEICKNSPFVAWPPLSKNDF